VVGQLNDDDGDGDIDSDDTPDIVIGGTQGYSANFLVAIDGKTGVEHWSIPLQGGVLNAIGDINGDNRPDIVSRGWDGVYAYHGDGTVLWHAPIDGSYEAYTSGTGNAGIPSIADLDGDGDIEVVTDGWIIDGTTGDLIASIGGVGSILGAAPAIGDIDLDGKQEIVIKNNVYRADGTLWWTADSSLQDNGWGSWPALVNVDEDDEAEIVFLANGMLGLYEHDGTPIHITAVGKFYGYPPAAADFDGDGEVELAWVSMNYFLTGADAELGVFEVDATPVWSTPVDTFSGLGAVSAFDFDSDGAADPIHISENSLYVMDGRTGAITMSYFGRQATTATEYAVVADIDGDQSAEILFTSGSFANFGISGSIEGLVVLGHPENQWGPGVGSWNQHAFVPGNIDDVGIIATQPDPSWLTHNLYRAAPAWPGDTPFPDLEVVITDACVTECSSDGLVRVALQVANTGPADVTDPVTIALFARSGTELTQLWSDTLDEVASGSTSEGIVVEVSDFEIGDAELVVRINDTEFEDSSVLECDLSNNEDVWRDDCG